MAYRPEEDENRRRMRMMIHLEIYVVDQASTMQAVWRRVLFDIDTLPPPGSSYMLYSTNGQPKWLFPWDGAQSGAHYDTRLEVWVVWLRLVMQEQVSFEHYGFALMDKSRWPTDV